MRPRDAVSKALQDGGYSLDRHRKGHRLIYESEPRNYTLMKVMNAYMGSRGEIMIIVGS